MGDLLGKTVRCSTLLIALAIGLSANCRAGELPDDLFARIDGEPIGAPSFEAFVRQHVRGKLYHGGSKDRLVELRREAADLLIERHLAAREAARRGIDATALVEQELAAVEAKYKDSADWPVIEPQLPEIRRQVTDSARIDRLRQEIEQVRDPDAAALLGFYEDNRQLFTEPERFHLKVILKLVPPSAGTAEWDQAKSTLQRLADEVAKGADFSQLASKHSDHETAKAGGDTGFVHKGQLSDEAQAAVVALRPGQTSAPVRVLEGYVLFRLEERLPEQLHPLAEVRQRALDLYRREMAARQWRDFVASLRRNARVELNQDIIMRSGEEAGTGD